MKTLLTNGWILKDAYAEPVREDLLIENGRIGTYIQAEQKRPKAEKTVDLNGMLVIPGLVQTHVHLCQVLFRGLADDLPLLSWLKEKIWPLEAAHDAESAYLSAMLGAMELIAGGVTTVCDMESVRYAQEGAKAIRDSGLRGVFGKVLMDHNDTPQALGGMPLTFFETTAQALENALKLCRQWHGTENDRIRYAFMPRGILTTSEDLLCRLTEVSRETGCLVHTHACETAPESELVFNRRGMTEIKYLHKLGVTKAPLLLAHCLCIDEEDIRILREEAVGVASCPLANLKLGSGIAPLERLRTEGIGVSLGSDGAPCNNTLDMFLEMRTASLLQKGLLHEPTAMTAKDTFHMATGGGACVLGWEKDIGTLAVGKKADLAVLKPRQRETAPAGPSVSALVYAGNPHMVHHVMVDGKWVYFNGAFPHIDEEGICRKAVEARQRVLSRL